MLIARHDGLGTGALRQLAIETVRSLGSGVVALVGAADGKAAIAVAVSKDVVARGAAADAIAQPAARALGGGVGKGAEIVAGGGANVDGVDEALALVREQAAAWQSSGAKRLAGPRAGRVLGVDLGERRIGLALSDPSRTVASPHDVLTRRGSHADDHTAIAGFARGAGVTTIVVGLPLSLSGRDGPAAKAARVEADELRAAVGLGIDVVLHDERLTTVTAEAALREAQMRRSDRQKVVDMVAAAVMLQSWLDTVQT